MTGVVIANELIVVEFIQICRAQPLMSTLFRKTAAARMEIDDGSFDLECTLSGLIAVNSESDDMKRHLLIDLP